jgi:DNA-binding IclR family transcriptional regulator
MVVPNNRMEFRILEHSKTAAPGTVGKAIDVLFHLHEASAACGLGDVARALALPKSSAHRLLASLVARGLVERDEDGRYRPGMALVALGLGVLEREPVVRAARPVLEAEARALGETLFLTAARGGRISVIDKVEAAGFLRAAPRIGEEVPVHATAVGRLQLAFAPGSVELPRGRLQRFTATTRTDAAVVASEVARARRDGFAVNREEWTPGLVVVAAPVLVGERLVATIAVGAPSARLGVSDEARVAARLRLAARAISTRLAGASPAAPHARSATTSTSAGGAGRRRTSATRRQGATR